MASGLVSPDGQELPPHRELSIRVFVRQGDTWRVTAFHNTMTPPRRLLHRPPRRHVAAKAAERQHRVVVELRDPSTRSVAVLREREPVPLPLHPDDDQGPL